MLLANQGIEKSAQSQVGPLPQLLTCNSRALTCTDGQAVCQDKEWRNWDHNRHTGSETLFSGQDAVSPLYLFKANSCFLLY